MAEERGVIPHAPLYGAFARMWALERQGFRVQVNTTNGGPRHFHILVKEVKGNFLGGLYCDDPDSGLDQIEEVIAKTRPDFAPSRTYIERVNKNEN